MASRKIERREKFKILHDDEFTCQYCGDNPGSKNLEVDHLIPRSKGGSDNRCNLVTACVTCNGRKSNTISFPKKMIERDDTEEGWKVHKSFGVWAVKFNDTTVVIEDNRSWWFDVLKLSRDSNFAGYHLQIKLESWEPQKADDFERCRDYVEQMIVMPTCRLVQSPT